MWRSTNDSGEFFVFSGASLNGFKNVVKHFLNLMFSNPSHETSETVHDRKMGIFAVNDEMNLAFKLNCPND